MISIKLYGSLKIHRFQIQPIKVPSPPNHSNFHLTSHNQKTHGCQHSSYLVPKVPNGPLTTCFIFSSSPRVRALPPSLPSPSLSLVATTGRLPPPHFARRPTALRRRRAPTRYAHPFSSLPFPSLPATRNRAPNP